MKTDVLGDRLKSVKLAIAQAESDLKQAIAEIRIAPRAEKVKVSEALEHAFATLRAAHAELAEIEKSIS